MRNKTINIRREDGIKVRRSLYRACPTVKCHDERPSNRYVRRKYNQNLRNGNYD